MGDLRDKTIKGLFWGGLDIFSSKGLSFLFNLLIARQLSPGDYGVIAILAVMMAICQCFVDSGFGAALVRKCKCSETDFSTIFYFNIFAALLFYIILYAVAPFIASFYEQPVFVDLTKIYSLVLIINALAIVQNSKLTIEVNFKVFAKISIISAIISGSAALFMAYKGFGIWSLVVQALTSATVRSLLLWVFSRWTPKAIFSWNSLNEHFSFGSRLLGSSLINELINNPGEFVILQFRHESELPASYKRTKKWNEIYNVLHKFDSQIVQWRPDLTIHDCRGKFIIITRDDYTNRTKAALAQSYPSGSTFTTTLTNVIGASTSYHVQDYYQYYGDGGEEKIKQILDLYNTKTKLFSNIDSPFFAEKAWALNHTSGYDGISGTTGRYQKNASQVHRPIHNTLTNETDFGPTGIVFMDWVGTREASSYTVYGDLLPQAIIDHNYKYRMLRATAQGTSN